MTALFKWTNQDARSWYDGEFGPFVPGKTLSVEGAQPGNACGHGIHLGKTAAHAISYGRFPGRLFSVRGVGDVLGQDDTKARFASVEVVKELPKPKWVTETESFIASIADVPWFKPKRKPRKEWKHHETGDAAWDAAWAAAWAAARDAAWDAARAAAGAAARDAAGAAELMALYAITSDLRFKGKAKHLRHVNARWDVWESGYGLACDVDGALYTYSKP